MLSLKITNFFSDMRDKECYSFNKGSCVVNKGVILSSGDSHCFTL